MNKELIEKGNNIGVDIENLRQTSVMDLDNEVQRISQIFYDFMGELEKIAEEEDAESTDKVE